MWYWLAIAILSVYAIGATYAWWFEKRAYNALVIGYRELTEKMQISITMYCKDNHEIENATKRLHDLAEKSGGMLEVVEQTHGAEQ